MFERGEVIFQPLSNGHPIETLEKHSQGIEDLQEKGTVHENEANAVISDDFSKMFHIVTK